MGDIGGMIKVTVVRGNRLAIRDFRTSDPYVVLNLENQTMKTKVINSCLNPTWNEEFTFTLVGSNPVLKLEVFDHDTFKYDDKMGHAFLNLQPLISASRLKYALQLSTGETKLRKVPVDVDNCLMEDSSIVCTNGEIVQDVRLRLCDVESGEIVLKVKWMGKDLGKIAAV